MSRDGGLFFCFAFGCNLLGPAKTVSEGYDTCNNYLGYFSGGFCRTEEAEKIRQRTCCAKERIYANIFLSNFCCFSLLLKPPDSNPKRLWRIPQHSFSGGLRGLQRSSLLSMRGKIAMLGRRWSLLPSPFLYFFDPTPKPAL